MPPRHGTYRGDQRRAGARRAELHPHVLPGPHGGGARRVLDYPPRRTWLVWWCPARVLHQSPRPECQCRVHPLPWPVRGKHMLPGSARTGIEGATQMLLHRVTAAHVSYDGTFGPTEERGSGVHSRAETFLLPGRRRAVASATDAPSWRWLHMRARCFT